MVFDGVGALVRGDLLILVYEADASLERTIWSFKLGEQFCDRWPKGILSLLLISANSRAPDQATRAEMDVAYKRVEGRVRRSVTVPSGGPLQRSVVRLVMGAHIMLHQKGSVHAVASSLEDGIRRVWEAASESTPGQAQIALDVQELRAALRAA